MARLVILVRLSRHSHDELSQSRADPLVRPHVHDAHVDARQLPGAGVVPVDGAGGHHHALMRAQELERVLPNGDVRLDEEHLLRADRGRRCHYLGSTGRRLDRIRQWRNIQLDRSCAEVKWCKPRLLIATRSCALEALFRKQLGAGRGSENQSIISIRSILRKWKISMLKQHRNAQPVAVRLLNKARRRAGRASCSGWTAR